MAMSGMGMTGIARAAPVKAVGLQLYTVRELFANDPVGTLEKVVRIGYREVEFGGGNYEKRSEEHTSELQSLMRISYAVFCLKKKNPTEHILDRLALNHHVS